MSGRLTDHTQERLKMTSDMLGAQYRGDNVLLTADEEHALGLRILAGDNEAAEELFRRNVRIVIAMTTRINCPRGLERDDLIQDGMIGLLKAVRCFDVLTYPGVKFSSHATWKIREAIDIARNKEAPMIHVPGSLRKAARKVARGESVSKKLLSLLTCLPVQVDADDDYGGFVHHAMAPDSNPLHLMEVAEDAKRLKDCVDGLPDRQEFVIRRRYAENSGGYKEIAQEMGLCRQRVKQIHDKAIQSLRRAMGVMAKAS